MLIILRLDAKRVANGNSLPAKEAPASAHIPTNTSSQPDSTSSSITHLQKASASTDLVAVAPVFTPKAPLHDTGVSNVTSLLSAASIDDDVNMEDVSEPIESDTQHAPANRTVAHATPAESIQADSSAQRLAEFKAALTGPQRTSASEDAAKRTASAMRASKWAEPIPRTPVVAQRRDSIQSLMSQSVPGSNFEYQLHDTQWTPKSRSERKALAAERQAWVDKGIRDRQIRKALESSPQPAGTTSSSSPVALTRTEQFRRDMLGIQPSVSKDKTPTSPPQVPIPHEEPKSLNGVLTSSSASRSGLTPQATLSTLATPTFVTKAQRHVLSEHTSMRKDSAVGISDTKNARPIAQAHRHPVSAGLSAPVSSIAREPEAPSPARAYPTTPTSPTKRVASTGVPTMPTSKRIELEKSSFMPFDETQAKAIEMSAPSTPASKADPQLGSTAAVPKPPISTNEAVVEMAAGTGTTISIPVPTKRPEPARAHTPASVTPSDSPVARRRRIATVRIVENQVPVSPAPNIQSGRPEPVSSPQLPLASMEPAVAETRAPEPISTTDSPVSRRRRFATVRIVEDGVPASPTPIVAGEQPQLEQATSAGQSTHPVEDLTNNHVAGQPAPVTNVKQQSLPLAEPSIADEPKVVDEARPIDRRPDPANPAVRSSPRDLEGSSSTTASAPTPVRAVSTTDVNQTGSVERPYTTPSRPAAPLTRPATAPTSSIENPAPSAVAAASNSPKPATTDRRSTLTRQITIGQASTATAPASTLTRPRRKIATVRIVGETSSPTGVAPTAQTPSHTRENSLGIVSGFQRLSLSPPSATKTMPTISASRDTQVTSNTAATNLVPATPVAARASHATTSGPLRDTSAPLRPATSSAQQAEGPEAAYLAKARSIITAKAAKINPRSISSTLRAQTPSSPAEDSKRSKELFFDGWGTPADRGRPGKSPTLLRNDVNIANKLYQLPKSAVCTFATCQPTLPHTSCPH